MTPAPPPCPFPCLTRRRSFKDVTGQGELELEPRRYGPQSVVAFTAIFRGIAVPGEQQSTESTVYLPEADAAAVGLSLLAGRDAQLSRTLRQALSSVGCAPVSHDLGALVTQVSEVLTRVPGSRP